MLWTIIVVSVLLFVLALTALVLVSRAVENHRAFNRSRIAESYDRDNSIRPAL